MYMPAGCWLSCVVFKCNSLVKTQSALQSASLQVLVSVSRPSHVSGGNVSPHTHTVTDKNLIFDFYFDALKCSVV